MTDTVQIITQVTRAAIEGAAWGVISKLALIYCVAAVALGGLNYLLATHTDIGRDETDPPAGRSDMKIMTDHETGCQYLMASRGGLTPRLDENGKPICIKKGGDGA
jgi:hypothetical protein